MPHRGAREQQVGDVGARDQEHQRDRAHHRQDHQLHVVRQHPRLERTDRGAPVLVFARVGFRETAGDAVEIGSRLCRRDAWLEPRKDLRGAAVAPGWLGDRRQRDPQALRFREPEPFGHDPDDRMGPAIDGDRTADHRRIPGVPTAPQIVGQEHDGFGSEPIVRRPEVTTECRRRAEQAEQRRRHGCAEKPFRLAGPVRDRQAAALEPGHGRKRCRLVAPVLEIGIRHPGTRDALFRVGAVEDHDPVGVRKRVGLQQHAVHHAEDRSVDSDPQRKAENRHDGEARIRDQSAERVAKVLEHVSSLN